MKHTPGPWAADPGGSVTGFRAVDRQPVNICYYCPSGYDTTDGAVCANARLIAAAPELLAVCKTVLARLDLEPADAVFPCSAMRKDIRAAITLAEGRTNE